MSRERSGRGEAGALVRLLRIGICVTLLVAAGCGQGSDVLDGGDADDQAHRLPAGFGVLAVAANDNWMVGVGPPPDGTDGPESVVVVDLSDATSKKISSPAFDGLPIIIVDMKADGENFVGTGYACPDSSGGDGCLGPQKLLHLDPKAGSWKLEDIPIDDGDVLGQMLPVGNDFLVLESNRGTVKVLRYDASGKWSEFATLDAPRRPAACATNTDLWLFARASGRAADPSANDASFTLTRIGLTSGQAENIDLPELAGYFGGVTTEFGCGQHDPFVASTPVGRVPPVDSDPGKLKNALTGVTVYQWTGRTWQPLDIRALDGHTVPDKIVSGPIPLLLAAEMIGGTEGNRPITVLLDDDREQQISTNGTDSYVWRGNTGDLIRIFDQGSQRYFETVSIGS